MWPQMVIKSDPVANKASGMLNCFRAVKMDALLFDHRDQSFDHAVLLWAMQSNELLLQLVALHQCGVAAGFEDQAIVRTQEEWRFDFAQRAIATDKRLL